MGFAIPITDIKGIIDELIKGNNDTAGASLGIEEYMTTSWQISNYRLPEEFYVSSIIESGNLYKEKELTITLN